MSQGETMENNRDTKEPAAADRASIETAMSSPPVEEEIAPSYAGLFRCIGPECEDTCCRDWSIPVDRKTYEIYTRFPEGRLGSLVAQSVSIEDVGQDSLFARINLSPSGFCPFYTPDQLCGIQKEYGTRALTSTCSIYPRTLNMVSGILEGSLALSCPEAARNILLSPCSTEADGNLLAGDFRTDNFARLSTNTEGVYHKPYSCFHAVRALLIEMIKDRSRPIWQRLILIGSLCKRLDGIPANDPDEQVPAILGDYRRIAGDATVLAQLESMPVDVRKRLDVFLRLTNERLHEKRSGKRFMDTFWDFIEGIGVTADDVPRAGAGPHDDVDRFRAAETQYYRLFFEERPYILENYLLNYIFQNLFPFGREGSPHFTRQSIFDEYVLMVTLYAWIDTLLIGIAGRYKDNFTEEHVVKTVQSFCRAVEHFPFVLVAINDYVRGQQLDSLQGMSILLR